MSFAARAGRRERAFAWILTLAFLAGAAGGIVAPVQEMLWSRGLRPAARFAGAVRADESFNLYRRDGRSRRSPLPGETGAERKTDGPGF
ncbi:MAG: hypothetical protein NTZ26_05050 [Candidatus Aminicenantes bacterium]|nr:hypothetical protein [Candidatus Aminicenantes bacterium]